jgi:diguanylate cyclase (GGDEF)-like protein/PAS domain S-box-containing protein
MDESLLLIDDHLSHLTAFREAVITTRDGQFHVEWVSTLSEGLERLSKKGVRAVFLNLFLPDSQGIETLDRLLLVRPGVPIVVLAGAANEDIAREALQRGAQDFLLEGHVDSYAFARAVRNMIERKTAEEVLLGETKLAEVTLNSIGDAVLSTDIAGNVTYLNELAEHMTGWSRKDASGRPFSEVLRIIDGSTRQPCPDPMELAMRQNRTVGLTANCILIRGDGHEAEIEDSAAPIHDREGRTIGSVIVFRDVGVIRAALRMSHLAQFDVLTDLPNRMVLTDRITQAISSAHRNGRALAILFLDLDGFKHINDSLGHAIGDELLQSVATRLGTCIRHSDTVSRLGGDEFVVLLSEVTHTADAAISAKKVLAALTAPHRVAQHELTVTASIGLSIYPADGQDAETLIRNADTAMLRAKQSGRNNYQFFRANMNARSAERQSVEEGLRHALRRKEFVLHYQPKIHLKTGAIIGAEALIRWQRPDHGLVSPRQFVPIAEECGLILPIGQWVLCHACRQARAWQDAGIRAIPVAVNVSSVEFRSEEFINNVWTILRDTRLEPRYLELELTESVLMQNVESTATTLNALRDMGTTVAIDDFGTGYSSLSYLRRFPIDALKLDRSFVQEITSDTSDAIISSAVINMGRSLKHRVVAEGVETVSQLAFLQAHGCDEGQGYYFSRPIVAQQFAKLVATGTDKDLLSWMKGIPIVENEGGRFNSR